MNCEFVRYNVMRWLHVTWDSGLWQWAEHGMTSGSHKQNRHPWGRTGANRRRHRQNPGKPRERIPAEATGRASDHFPGDAAFAIAPRSPIDRRCTRGRTAKANNNAAAASEARTSTEACNPNTAATRPPREQKAQRREHPQKKAPGQRNQEGAGPGKKSEERIGEIPRRAR